MTFAEIISIAPFEWQAVFTSIACGSIIGLERQLRGKPVGIRTSALIVLGTYIFIAASMLVSTSATDPSRIIGQVITGIGFLGAGVMLARDGVGRNLGINYLVAGFYWCLYRNWLRSCRNKIILSRCVRVGWSRHYGRLFAGINTRRA